MLEAITDWNGVQLTVRVEVEKVEQDGTTYFMAVHPEVKHCTKGTWHGIANEALQDQVIRELSDTATYGQVEL